MRGLPLHEWQAMMRDKQKPAGAAVVRLEHAHKVMQRECPRELLDSPVEQTPALLLFKEKA